MSSNYIVIRWISSNSLVKLAEHLLDLMENFGKRSKVLHLFGIDNTKVREKAINRRN